MTEKFNEALDEMRADGTLAELSKQFYDGADVTVQIEYDFPVIDVSNVD